MKKIVLPALIVAAGLSIPQDAFADNDDWRRWGGGRGGGNHGGGGNNVPLDGGVTLLAAAGIGYGIKKYRDNKKTSKN